jgi:thiamine kinase-like enzyme
MRSLNPGGASLNYKISLENKSLLLKVLPLSKRARGENLLLIYQNLGMIENLASANLCAPTKSDFLLFKDYILIFMDFIEGRRMEIKDLCPHELSQIIQNEIILSRAVFQKTDFIAKPLTPQNLFENTLDRLQKIKQTSSLLFYQKRIFEILQNIFENAPQINKSPCLIHGDTGPNNFILNKQGKLFFIDFEMIRYGQLSEDLAQFLLSPLLQHSIWFFNQKKFIESVMFFNNSFDLSFNDWLYGVSIYFLRLANRRLSSPKILKSPRKAWLFYKHLQKYEKILKLLKTLY